MKERPILFNGSSVRSILEDRKTQTRRVIKLEWSRCLDLEDQDDVVKAIKQCPYGQVGDRLWVKETWKVASFMEDMPIEFQYKADGAELEENRSADLPETWLKYNDWYERICGQSTSELETMKWPANDDDGHYAWDAGKSPLRWRPSIFMPRWASRITLEIVKVRVERLQDIGKDENVKDIFSEGLCKANYYETDPEDNEVCGIDIEEALEDFSDLWSSINAKRGYGWNANPWVWVIEFHRMEQA